MNSCQATMIYAVAASEGLHGFAWISTDKLRPMFAYLRKVCAARPDEMVIG